MTLFLAGTDYTFMDENFDKTSYKVSIDERFWKYSFFESLVVHKFSYFSCSLTNWFKIVLEERLREQ